MKYVTYILVFTLLTMLAIDNTFAQSSGNFAASINTAKCSVNNSNGDLTGGFVFCDAPDGNVRACPAVQVLSTTLKTPNSDQTAILAGASLGVGIYTKTKTKGKGETSSSASSNGRVDVTVEICDEDGNNCEDIAPSPVTFAQRFQKLTVQLDQEIDECQDTPETCDPESVELLLSTLEMNHSNFVAPNPGGGLHTLKMTVSVDGNTMADMDNEAEVAICAGPGVFTVQQVKAFSQSGGIEINP